MSLEKARSYLEKYNMADRIILFDTSTATVSLAADALGVFDGNIAKTLSFMQNDGACLIVMAGDHKVDNRKYKDRFSQKATMLDHESEALLIGHEVGGVCPFGINDGIKIYLDVSLRGFDTVYPAAGNASSAVRLTPDELASVLPTAEWTDVCKKREAQ